MTDVKVLGMGCANCRRTQALIEDVAKSAGIQIAVEKVEDPQQFAAYGVMRTPGVVIDGRVVQTTPVRIGETGSKFAKLTGISISPYTLCSC